MKPLYLFLRCLRMDPTIRHRERRREPRQNPGTPLSSGNAFYYTQLILWSQSFYATSGSFIVTVVHRPHKISMQRPPIPHSMTMSVEGRNRFIETHSPLMFLEAAGSGDAPGWIVSVYTMLSKKIIETS